MSKERVAALVSKYQTDEWLSTDAGGVINDLLGEVYAYREALSKLEAKQENHSGETTQYDFYGALAKRLNLSRAFVKQAVLDCNLGEAPIAHGMPLVFAVRLGDPKLKKELGDNDALAAQAKLRIMEKQR